MKIYAETEDGRILFIVGKLFHDGNFYVISSRWTNEMRSYYYSLKEVLLDDEN